MATLKKTLIVTVAGLALTGAAGAALADRGPGQRHGFHHRHGHAGAMHMLERLDGNKDGTVTRAEADRHRDEAIGRHDSDSNGTISLKEFEGLWMEHTRQRMVRAFQRLDADGDGQVTKDEVDRPTARMFRHLDRDGDGQISVDERHARDKGDRHRGRHGGGR